MTRLAALLAFTILGACLPVQPRIPQPQPRAPQPAPRAPEPGVPEPETRSPQPRGAQTELRSARPELHIGYQHVPRDGTGRLGGSAVDELTITRHNTFFWIPHVMRPLFLNAAHDRFWRRGAGGEWTPDPQHQRQLDTLIDRVAAEHLDAVAAILDGRPPASRIRIFVDLEHATVGRTPYVEPEAEGYGSRDVKAMNLLCDRIEALGHARFGVEVFAGPYRPIRPNGHWSGLSNAPPEFVREWRSADSGIWPLLDRDIVWVHCYAPEDPADFKRQPQNHRQFARANIRDQFSTILQSGARPKEVWVVGWFYTCPTALESEGIMRGLRDVLSERPGGWPWETHIAWAGGWESLNHLLEQPVERRQRVPLVLNVPADVAGNALARAWVREVEEPYRRVFTAGDQP